MVIKKIVVYLYSKNDNKHGRGRYRGTLKSEETMNNAITLSSLKAGQKFRFVKPETILRKGARKTWEKVDTNKVFTVKRNGRRTVLMTVECEGQTYSVNGMFTNCIAL